MTPIYLNTAEMAKAIGKTPNYLKQRKGNDFKLNQHYFHPNGQRDPFWKVEAVILWVEGNEASEDDEANKILDRLTA